MPPPTPLQIATSSLIRLRRELSTYHTELSTQQGHLSRAIAQQKTASSSTSSATNGASAAADDQPAGNLEYEIKQEERAIEETKRMFGPLEEKIRQARGRLEGLVRATSTMTTTDRAGNGAEGQGEETEELKKARAVLEEMDREG